MDGPFADDARSNLERMRAGEDYVADAEIDRLARRAQRLAHDYTAAYHAGPEHARATLEELLGGVGPGVDIRPPLFVDYGSNITIGEGTFVNFNLTALDVAPIVIGRDCQFGPNVQLLTPTHPIDPARRRERIESSQPIEIGDNVWLGGGVIVLPGVTIGSDTVIGAGAVVTRSIPSGVVAVGNPARVVRTVAG